MPEPNCQESKFRETSQTDTLFISEQPFHPGHNLAHPLPVQAVVGALSLLAHLNQPLVKKLPILLFRLYPAAEGLQQIRRLFQETPCDG